MVSFDWLTIGVHGDSDDPYAPYYLEALAHAGIPFTRLQTLSAAALSEIGLLALCGAGEVTKSVAASIADWVAEGNALVCSGSSWGLGPLIGASAFAHCSRGAIARPDSDDLWPFDHASSPFFGGQPCRASASVETLIRSSDNRAAATRRKVGRGSVSYFAPHLGQTMAQIQLGRSVEVDGVGAPDGSARLDDGVLRSEDGIVLDFERDREAIPGSPFPAFRYPICDHLKEMWLRMLLQAAVCTGKTLPVVWCWPNNGDGAALLSVECKGYAEEPARRLERVTGLLGVRPGWLIGIPGFSLDVYRGLRNREQEVGLLFSSERGHAWHEERMKIQHVALSRAAGVPHMVSARPEDGKWQGWTTFYEMCESAGARLSLSKGGRQPGTSGFPFGTSHPFLPLKRDGEPFLVMELPYCAYMPGSVTPLAMAEDHLDQVAVVAGCFHVAINLDDERSIDAIDAVRRLFSMAKQRGLAFFTPEEVYRFERARRAMHTFTRASANHGFLTLVSDTEVEGITVLLLGPDTVAKVRGREFIQRSVKRFGLTAKAVVLNLEAKKQVEIALELDATQKAA